MLQEIYKEMVATLRDRGNSSTVYCGWGTTIDRLIEEYLSTGGPWRIIRQLEILAEHKKCTD